MKKYNTLLFSKKIAFTLAEILITLTIMGVIAAITLPRFFDNMTERINSERQANIAQKVTQAMEQMRAHGLLNQNYTTTEKFVDELQKYLKIAKRCDSNHITECWPTNKVIMSNKEEFEVKNAQKGKNLWLSTKTNNVGLILADGGAIILNYNPETQSLDVGDAIYEYPEGGKELPVGNGKSKRFAYTTSVTSSIDFVMDVNGSKGPNSEANTQTRDIRSFKTAQFSRKNCQELGKNGVDVPGIGCVVNLGAGYAASGDTIYYNGQYRLNRWQDAVNACNAQNMTLPDYNTLLSIYNSHTSGLPNSGWYWSTTTISEGFYYIYNFGEGRSGGGIKGNDFSALCVW